MDEGNKLSREEALNGLSRVAEALCWLAEMEEGKGAVLRLLGEKVGDCLVVLDGGERSW